MALSLSNVFHSPKPRISLRNCNLKTPVSSFQSSNVRLPRSISWNRRVIICATASAAGSSNQDSELNPYEVLGVSPIEGFDMVKASYTKKRKEAERNNDEATVARLEKAYDKLMMQQLSKQKKGVTFGSVKVSKDIKYADKQPIVPWGPRYTKSSDQDVRINLTISAAFVGKITLPFCKGMPNEEGLTAKELFMKEHKEFAALGEKWMKDTANSGLLVTTHIATVVPAAAFTVSGGNDNISTRNLILNICCQMC